MIWKATIFVCCIGLLSDAQCFGQEPPQIGVARVVDTPGRYITIGSIESLWKCR